MAATEELSLDKKSVLTYGQIRNLLMNFADQYMQMIGQAADTLKKLNPDPDTRARMHSIKIFPCSAAFSIAVESNPQIALLDMVVLVHLQGRIWKEESTRKKLGDNAAILLDAQDILENDIDTIALKVLTPEQLEHLKTLVSEWLERFPNQRYVSYIRFADFAELQHKRRGKMQNPFSIGTLLSTFQLVNVEEASRSVDQARMVAERALYLSERMPLLCRWQAEMLYYEIASTAETKNILATSQALGENIDRLTKLAENFPALLAAERKAAIEQLADETDKRSRIIIFGATKACLIILFVVFLLAILYKVISRKI